MKRQEAAESPQHTFDGITWGKLLVSSETGFGLIREVALLQWGAEKIDELM